MTWLRSATILFLVAFWLPMSMHCRLVRLPALSFLACCDHPGAVPHEDSDCDLDGCDVVEGGLYQAEMQPRTALRPAVVVTVPAVPPRTSEEPAPAARGPAPPGFQTTWHFACRAAPPTRAPSFLA